MSNVLYFWWNFKTVQFLLGRNLNNWGDQPGVLIWETYWVAEQVLVKLYSAHRVAGREKFLFFHVHFIYCSILKACMIRTHVKWTVFENTSNNSFPDDFGSCQWQLLRPFITQCVPLCRNFDWLQWANMFNYSPLMRNFQYYF